MPDMANIVCSMCNVNQAAFILTNLDTGDAEQPCAECFPEFILGIAQAMTAAIAGPDAETAPTTEGGDQAAPVATESGQPTGADQGESTETPPGAPETPSAPSPAPTPSDGPTTEPGLTPPGSADPGTASAPEVEATEPGSVAPVAAS